MKVRKLQIHGPQPRELAHAISNEFLDNTGHPEEKCCATLVGSSVIVLVRMFYLRVWKSLAGCFFFSKGSENACEACITVGGGIIPPYGTAFGTEASYLNSLFLWESLPADLPENLVLADFFHGAVAAYCGLSHREAVTERARRRFPAVGIEGSPFANRVGGAHHCATYDAVQRREFRASMTRLPNLTESALPRPDILSLVVTLTCPRTPTPKGSWPCAVEG